MWDPFELRRVPSEDGIEDVIYSAAEENLFDEYNDGSPNDGGEATRLLPRHVDGRPRTMGNVVQSQIDSTQALAEGGEARGTSNTATMMHLFKGNVGTGILAMPNAIMNAGLLVGTVGIPILGILCVHCMHLLVISSKALARRLEVTSLDYQTTAEKAFALGPARIQRYSPAARFAVNVMLILTQFGFCCVYFLFVSKSIHEVVVSIYGSSRYGPSEYMAMMLPVMMVLNFIPDLEKLSRVSTCANILQFCGLLVVLFYGIRGPYSTDLNVYTAPISRLPLYFGTAMYSFEGIGVVLYLENAMATPQDFGGLNGVLNTCMTIVAALYTAVGFYGYLKFGNAVKSSITFNLPMGLVSNIVRSVFGLAIFLSYPLQFQIPLSMISPYIKEKFNLKRFSERKQLLIELTLRTVLVFFTYVLASVIPHLHLFIALVGAFASTFLALIFPPIIELAIIWISNISRRKFIAILIKDVVIISVGVLGSIVGSYVAIDEIGKCLRNPSAPTCQV